MIFLLVLLHFALGALAAIGIGLGFTYAGVTIPGPVGTFFVDLKARIEDALERLNID